MSEPIHSLPPPAGLAPADSQLPPTSTRLPRMPLLHLPPPTCRLPLAASTQVLLGTYVSTEASGEFKWQPGVVCQAVAAGRWLLLEDVDRAPVEVMAALAPLLEGGALYLPGRATSLTPPPAFRLFATLTVGAREATAAAAAAAAARTVFRPSLWQLLFVPTPSAADLAAIVAARQPCLRLAAKAMVKTLHALIRATGGPLGAVAGATVAGTDASAAPTDLEGAADEPSAAAHAQGGAEAAEAALDSARCALGAGRAYSSRDLLKWAHRLAAALVSIGLAELPAPSSPHLTGPLREVVLVEALDAFVQVPRLAPTSSHELPRAPRDLLMISP